METSVQPLKMTEKSIGFVLNYWQEVKQSREAGKLVAWCTTLSPFELLTSMGITTVFPEGYGAICAVEGVSTELCQRADALGYSSDLCSVIRNFIGAIDGTEEEEKEKLPFGGLPKPDVLICVTYCPGLYKKFKRYSEIYNVPLIVMERPRIHDSLSKEQIEGLVKEGTQEVKDIIPILEKLTGNKFSYDKLSECMAIESKVAGLWHDCLGLCKHTPSPMTTMDAFDNVFPFYMYRCSPQAVTYYEEMKKELEERVANNIGSLVTDEKYRLYWDIASIPHKNPEISKKFIQYGAVPVVGMFPYYFGYDRIDPKKPIESMVETIYFHKSNLGVSTRVEDLLKQIQGFSLDGLILQKHRTCQVQMLGSGDLMEALVEKTGLPAVEVEGDPCDGRFYSSADFNSKMDGFMEILTQRGQTRW
ncbi:MAG: 2-hydroxyacyl-CoA dehydratase family protein [Pseudomonadota bacterium]